MEADAQERISVHLKNSLKDAKARFTEHSIAFKEINRQLGNSEEKFKLLKKAAADLKKQLESTVETIKKVTAPKGELLDFPKVLTDKEKERVRRAKEANEQLNETIRLIEEETVAIKQGEIVLKEFTRELKIQKQIQTLINKLKKEPFESEEAFLLRQAELLERITNAIKGRADAQRAALQEKVAAQAFKNIAALEAEIDALKDGVEAYEEYKRARTIDADIEAFEKRMEAAFGEGEAVEHLIDKYIELREELEEVKKVAKELAEEQKRLDRLAERLGATFVSAFEDAIAEGKSFKEVIRALENDIIKIILRFLLIDPIIQQIKNSMKGLFTTGGGGGIGGFFSDIIGSIFGGGTGVGTAAGGFGGTGGIGFVGPFKKGGVVGRGGGAPRAVSLSMFTGAQKFTGGGIVGLRPGEVPIIADRGETIRTPAQEQALRVNMTPRIVVNFNFPPGTGVDDFRRSQNQLAADASMILRSAQRNL